MPGEILMKIPCAFLMLVLLLLQCRGRATVTADIDPRLRPMLDSFLLEASARNVELKPAADDLVIQFGRIAGKKGGSCKPDGIPKIITIDSMKWKFIDDAEKESLVFHELAHCLLLRPHNNETLKFGECKSLLREILSNCHINWSNKKWRSYYLDQLFAPNETTVPEWHSTMPEVNDLKDMLPLRQFRLKGAKFQYFDTPSPDGYCDWLINVTACRPARGLAYMGFSVNEINLDVAFVRIHATSDSIKSVVRLSILHAGTQTLLAEATSESETMHLSFRQYGSAIYIFFDKTLQYAMPMSPSALKIGGYSSLPQSHYNIGLYRINDEGEF